MNNDIKYIVFDFGGVIYKINPELTMNLLLDKSSSLRNKYNGNSNHFINDKIITEFECGKISSGEFRRKVNHELGIYLTETEFDNIWNSTLTGIDPDAVNIIRHLITKFNMSLVSNTNEIHYAKFSPECLEIFSYFDNTFFSFQIGLRKPDIKIYKLMVDKIGLNPNQILFVDDTEENISGAINTGFKTHLFKGQESLNYLENLVQV